jgi:hypothetical protein
MARAGAPQNYRQALRKVAAEQRNATAQNNLGLLYWRPWRSAGLCAGYTCSTAAAAGDADAGKTATVFHENDLRSDE